MGLTSKLDKLKLRSLHESTSTTPVQSSPKASNTKPAQNEGSGVNTDDIDEIDNEGQSILSGIIAQLRPGCDLAKITLPTFILEKKSMLERITNFFQIPDVLFEANSTEDELERFLLIVKWYLASWHIAPKAVKKPLNPVLGEIFTCYWDDLPGENDAYYISEQTSHHPPKSSYFYLVPARKIRVDGTVIPVSKFLGNSSAAMMHGWGHLTLGEWDNEVYIMNQPNVYCRGILFGKLKYELGDHMTIKCPKTGYEADIEFKTKGFIGGTYDAIDGVIKKTSTSEALYNLSGKWNEVMYLKDLSSGETETFYDTSKSVRHLPKVRPLEEQFDFESRKLWGPTIKGLSVRDHQLATDEKFKVENEQRELAKRRLETGEEFYPRLFKAVDSQDKESQDLEFLIYKKFNLKDDPAVLADSVFESVPIRPGQSESEDFDLPAFEKGN